MAVLIQIIGFFVTFSRSTTDLNFYDINGQLLNTCLNDHKDKHFADWCTRSMIDQEGFFAGSLHQSSNALVLFIMSMLLIVAGVFTSGLVILLLS